MGANNIHLSVITGSHPTGGDLLVRADLLPLPKSKSKEVMGEIDDDEESVSSDISSDAMSDENEPEKEPETPEKPDERNEVGSSQAMEFHAFKKALEFLLNSGVRVSHFVSDRHLAILACMKENHKDILHQIDLWHLKKSRTALAAIHFNNNLKRQVKFTKDGYIDELFKVFINASENELANAREQLKGLCPPPMNVMLEKQPKDQAVAKHYARKLMKVPNVQGTGREASKIKQRQKPMCKKCSVPMKQHHCPFK
eukprot:gene15902-7235_t